MIEAFGLSLVAGAGIVIAWWFARALWNQQKDVDRGTEWASALPPARVDLRPRMDASLLPALPVDVAQRRREMEERVIAMQHARAANALAARPLVAVIHEGASEIAPLLGAIGTLAAEVSDDLLTYAEQVAGAPDEWSGFAQALVAYEDAMLTRRTWDDGKRQAIESTQQRIDRWLSEGGVGVERARVEMRKAVSETWDSPSRELALVDRPDAERVAEAALTA